MTAALILLTVLALAATAFYDFMQGETLVRDLIDEARLHRADVHALDRAWSANPDRSDCVVCLTSLPSRLPLIAMTLKSLLRQSRAPARIRLHLPEFSRRENTAYEVPAWLATLESVEVVRTPDWGPATKLIPAVTSLPPEHKIVVVDDDRIYPASLIADLEAAAERLPDAALSLGGWVTPTDCIDRPTTVLSSALMRPPAPLHALRLREPVPVDIVQGLAGVLVRPRFFDLAALCDYSAAPAAAFFVDDVWMSAHCLVPKYVVPARRAGHVTHWHRRVYRRTSLARVNAAGGDVNTHNNTVMLRYFAGRWRVGGTGSG
jgi:hypothetical protein